MAVLTFTVGGTTPDYTTIAAAEASIPANMVTDDNQRRFQCRDVTFAEADIDWGAGVTTDATRFAALEAESGTAFDGVAGNGPVMNPTSGTSTAGGHIIRLDADFSEIINIEITSGQDSYTDNELYSAVKFNSGDCRLLRCILHDMMQTTGTKETGAVLVPSNVGGDVFILNNIVYEFGDGSNAARGIEINLWDAGNTYHVIGNAVYNMHGAVGIEWFFDNGTASTGNFYNNLVMGSGGDDYDITSAGDSTVNGSHNGSGDLTASVFGSNEKESLTDSTEWVSVTGGSEDFHLKSGATSIAAGSDRGTTPSGVEFDIDDFDRDDAAVTWDIGADQFVSSGVSGIADFNLPVMSITGIGHVARAGIADFNLPVPTITGIGDIPIVGLADFSLPSMAITGIGDLPIVGLADFNLPVITITGAGAVALDGIADFNLPVPTITGAGLVSSSTPVLGDADFDLPSLGIAGVGLVAVAGIADFNLPIITITGIGDIPLAGVADFNLPNLAITGAGFRTILGIADFNLPSLTIPAVGDVLIKGVADFDLPNLGLSATGIVGAFSAVAGIADFNLPSLWVNTQGGVDIPMVNIFSTSGQSGAETGTAFTLSRKAGSWFINRDVLAQVILGSGSATIHIEVSLDGGSTFADIVSSVTASAILAFNLPPIIRVRLSAATAATVNVWLDADLVVTRVNN